MGNLVAALRAHSRVGFDTPIFVYHIEATSRFAALSGLALRALTEGPFSGVTSVMTLLELTVKPLRLGRPAAAEAYESLVLNIVNLTVVGIDRRVCRRAAELRAAYGLRTPDALQIAACIADGATVFLTNDRRLRRVKEIDVLILADFLAT